MRLISLLQGAVAKQSLQYARQGVISQVVVRQLSSVSNKPIPDVGSVPKTFIYGARVTSRKERESDEDPFVVSTKRRNVPQSPWKMRFLVMLMRGAWFPDAVAQMKFSPKHRATDMNQLLSNAYNIARIKYDAIPEELVVKDVFVTKGLQRKRMRIMGRGRTGFGYQRSSHVFIKLTKVDFPKMIKKGNSQNKKEWKRRFNIVKKLKLVGGSSSAGVETKQ